MLMPILNYTRLQELKNKIRQQRKHLDDLDNHMYVFPIAFLYLDQLGSLEP